MTDEWAPEPEPAGNLQPPRRNPPTAVGVLTPPPPHRPQRTRYRASSLRRRLAQAFLGASGAFAGIAAASIATHPVAVAAGSLLALAGARLLGISVRSNSAPRELALVPDRKSSRKRAA
ncbi:MAG: hypothetical protein KF709_12945 [Gemmatimonadaceae bacterium]|nr:hypothetical protein [Gemmatimonadaceae bacterium]